MSTLFRLERERLRLEDEIAKNKIQLEEINGEISRQVEPVIRDMRNRIGKQVGTIESDFDGCMIRHSAPKRVEWDQPGLAELRAIIAEDGGNPDAVVTAKYSISEKNYDLLDPFQKKRVDPFRTVKSGKPKITIQLKGA